MRSAHYAFTSPLTRVIFVSTSIFVMLFYRQNHNGNIFTQQIYSLNIAVMSTFSYFSVFVLALSKLAAISGDDVFNVKCTEKAHI